jgi:putative ABC transport system ATP-binding protein
MSDFILEAKDVTMILGRGAAQVHALKDIKLSLRGGELTVLMGPSGSGKTTLLSVLGCILTPTSGTVRVCGLATQGADAEALAKLRRDHVGFVFQSYHLFPTLTAAENIQLALDIRGTYGEDARMKSRDALEKVGLAHKTASYPRELSGGEQQRVAIARAIVSNPSAILADEPTAVLDTSNGRAIMSILAEIAKDPAHGVLVVTHDSRMTSFADRVIHIEDGRLVRDNRGSADAAKIQTTALAGRCA